jgi:hypothetical protein
MKPLVGEGKPFHSAVDKTAALLKRKVGTGAEFMKELMGVSGVKPTELQERGLTDIMGMPKMTHEQFMSELGKKPAPAVEEKVLGEEPSPEEVRRAVNADMRYIARSYANDNSDTSREQRMLMADEIRRYRNNPEIRRNMAQNVKYNLTGAPVHETYTLPGGDNYREMLIKLPRSKERETFAGVSAHFGYEPNILASMRLKDRTGPNGEKLLHLEELQSDWHQEGRKKGYKSNASEDDVRKAYNAQEYNAVPFDELRPEDRAYEIQKFRESGVPDAPFKKNWEEMALKRLIHHAAEKGYHGIVVTPGIEQAKRYNIGDHVNELHYTGSNLVGFNHKGDKVVDRQNVKPEELPEHIGKELAEKLISQEPQGTAGQRSLKGQDIVLGGEGMKGFYDKKVPNILNSIGKKYGVKTELHGHAEKINNGGLQRNPEGGYTEFPPEFHHLHHFPITEEMRKDVLTNGLPLYNRGGTVHMADGGDMDQMQLEMMDKKMKQDSVGHYSSKGSVKKKDQTVKNAQRMAYPGIYGNPKDIAALAASRVATEDPALKLLFGVTRADMYQQAQGRKGMPHLGMLPGMAANPKGSMAAEGVMNKRNEQRLIDVMGEAQKHQGLVHGMEPWYYMNPLFDHMVKLLGLQKATEEYKKMNALMGMASSSSEVNTEIPRGSLAYWLQNQGRFNEFVKHGGKRSEDRPADFGETPGHLAHKTAHALPMQKFLERGEVDMNSPKVPMYIEASGVPATGFQTRTPVGDAHWSRAVGLADTRNPKTIKGKEVVPGASVSTPEMSSLGPWWQQNIASKLGLESVPAQALTWGAFSPQTGVTTPIGAPKLELIAKQIMQTANRLGVSPQTARDMVLTGKERMGKAHGGAIHMADGGQVDVQSIGVEEAPNMDIKAYFPPRPAQGSMLPVGGIQQAPMQPQQPQPAQPQPSDQPPMQPNQQDQQMRQPPSNILQMTPQGHAMSAMTPPRQMARGGQVDLDTMMLALMNRNKKAKYG